MVGLPGSGKSHWARTHMKQHPEKQYRLLGTEELLACMIVSQTSNLHSHVFIFTFDDDIHDVPPTDLSMVDLCVCVCVEWWTEGRQAAAGLSVSN